MTDDFQWKIEIDYFLLSNFGGGVSVFTCAKRQRKLILSLPLVVAGRLCEYKYLKVETLKNCKMRWDCWAVLLESCELSASLKRSIHCVE